MPLRICWEFFANENMPDDQQIFAEKFHEHMWELRPMPVAHHIKPRIIILKDLYTCSHVSLRTDGVKSPLQPLYTGPYEVVKRLISYLSSKLREKKSWSEPKDWNQPTLPKRTCHMSNSLVKLQGHILVKEIHMLCQQWLWQCH
jgi:hypothetical protein